MYEPQVNDYVIWKNDIEGWVYFKDKEYITIELFVRRKNDVNYRDCSIHANERLLVLCYNSQWKELIYVKSRPSIYDEEKEKSLGESIVEDVAKSLGEKPRKMIESPIMLLK
jgi:hypothetical protein